MVFNRLKNLQALPMIVKKNALLKRLVGKQDIGRTFTGKTEFERARIMTGLNIEVKLLGALSSTTLTADGSAELATVTPSFSSTQYGAAEFPLSHRTFTKGIPSSQIRRFKGKESKDDSFYAEVMREIMWSYEADLGTDIHSTTGTSVIARDNPGSWCFGVSDGTSTGETGDAFKLYGKIDRSDSANADFRGIIDDAGGKLTLDKIRSNINAADAKGGVTDTLVMGTTLFTAFQLLVEQYVHQTNVTSGEFGAQYVCYDGACGIHDQRCPSGTIGGLDSSTWEFVLNDDEMTSGMVKDPSRVSAYVVPTEIYYQLYTFKPNANFKMKNYTA